MSLIDYIPTGAEVDNCIKTVAEGANEAVLLAVHQPAPLSKRLVHGPEKVQTSEIELLAHILTSSVATGALVVPITGASGAGKSHLIRVIETRLRNSREAKRYHIIRVPKSASLRKVVELILEPLPDKEYAAVKGAFRNALAEVDVEAAAIRFQGELEIALGKMASDLLEKVRLTATQDLREQLDHAKRLPLLLRDVITSEHFRKAVFPRIVKRAVAGDKEGDLDPTEGQFRGSDLDLPDEVDLGQAGKAVATYYRLALQARNGQGKTVAVGVLNSVVDQATRQLFSLHEALGGMTLQDVILEIRRRLLQEGLELILLVEDFAALTGIQETLARVLIQEGVRDGRPEFATMRSVIAVTDGYLVSRDTLATRAMHEWIVESEIESQDEIFERTEALVASYLNASRWGQAELVSRFAKRKSHASTDSSQWLPIYRSEDDEAASRLLNGFGVFGDIPLFPFSDLAIQHLAKRALTHGDTLVFNPRFIISEVLRRVLVGARDAFLANEFPPIGIEARRASADVAAWTTALPEGEAVRRRYETVAVVWGDNPQSLGEVANIPGSIFQAFGLREPSFGDLKPRSPRKRIDKRPDQSPPDPAKQGELAKYRSAFEEWVQGTRLEQAIANDLRKHVASAINEQIDWNAERTLKVPIQPDCISIPNARGEEGLQAGPIRVAETSTDPDGALRRELLSVIRLYEIHPTDQQYDGRDDDLLRVANFVERLLPQAKERTRTKTTEQLRQSLLAVAGNSRLLGIAEIGKTLRALSNFLFGNPPAQEALPAMVKVEEIKPAIREWRDFQNSALTLRPALIELALAHCGCFQGIGDKSNGVDIVRVLEHYPPPEMRLELAKMDRVGAQERMLLQGMGETRVAARFRAVRLEAQRLRDLLSKSLGADFEKETVATQLKELANALKEIGVWDSEAVGVTQPAFLNLCEAFRASALKEALEQLGKSDATDAEASKYTQLLLGPLLIGAELLSRSDVAVRIAERRAVSLEQQISGVDPEEQAKAIQQSFVDLEEHLGNMQ